ncbi:MAG: hypothetical protein KF712_11975 [Akkermansiaceae bacterium]|nr:hypothetical protein [Akkermansiaceae bacterium]
MISPSRWLPLFVIAVAAILLAPASMADLVIRNTAGEVITSLDAGSTIKDDPRSIEIRIENTGTTPVGNLVSFTGPAAGDFSIGGIYGTSIPAKASVTAYVYFKPQALGLRMARLSVGSSDPGSTNVFLDLAGTGSTVFEPIFVYPDSEAVHVSFNAQGYSIGKVTINFPPDPHRDLLIARIFSGMFTNHFDPVRVRYQDRIYLYELAYRQHLSGRYTWVLALSSVTGQQDTSFNHPLNTGGGTVAVQPDGRLIVTGGFLNPGGTGNQRIARLHPDGSIDTTFVAAADGIAACVFLQEDGKILMAGPFSKVNGVVRSGLARLHPDGSLDEGFVPPVDVQVARVLGMKDGKILAGGPSPVSGGNGSGLLLLHPDGSVDHSFDAGITSSTAIYSLAEEADGGVLVGGVMTIGDTARYLCRLHPDGSLDTGFQGSTNANVSAIIVQPDGKLLIAGGFNLVNGRAQAKGVARLHPDGSLDEAFVPGPLGLVWIHCILLQADGRILIGGTASNDLRWGSSRLTRMEADGADDVTFAAPTMHLQVTGLSMGADGSVFVNGSFGPGNGLLKLRNHPGVSDLLPAGSGGLKWTRTGAVPELQAVVFENSADGGVTWSRLGEGSRVADGWVLDGGLSPGTGFLRARGVGLASNRGYAAIRETIIHGRNLTALETWRQVQLGSPLNEGVSADGFDHDRDGISNLLEYAFALNPKLPDAHLFPVWQKTEDGYELIFPKYLTVGGITYHPEWSETMRADDWHPGETVGDGTRNIFRIPFGPEDRKFFRLRVENP